MDLKRWYQPFRVRRVVCEIQLYQQHSKDYQEPAWIHSEHLISFPTIHTIPASHSSIPDNVLHQWLCYSKAFPLCLQLLPSLQPCAPRGISQISLLRRHLFSSSRRCHHSFSVISPPQLLPSSCKASLPQHQVKYTGPRHVRTSCLQSQVVASETPESEHLINLPHLLPGRQLSSSTYPQLGQFCSPWPGQ